jgi:hypothetical protein
VNISFNHIETFNFDLPVLLDKSSYTTLELTLEGNPLLCDCSATGLKEELAGGRLVSLRNPRSITCASSSPTHLLNMSLIDVKFEVSKYR